MATTTVEIIPTRSFTSAVRSPTHMKVVLPKITGTFFDLLNSPSGFLEISCFCSSTVEIQCETPFRFRCDNNRCIYSHELCNSVDDCGDGSDERQENCKCDSLYLLLTPHSARVYFSSLHTITCIQSIEVNMFLSFKVKARLMDHVQMNSTNAVTGSASLCSLPVMIMMTVETSQMSLAAVSTLTKSDYGELQKE